MLSWSYDNLHAPAARMFRLLGLHPGPDITIPAAGSLADVPPDHARELLHELTRMNLLTEHAPARFTFHDLLRAYAAGQAETTHSEEERRAALTRLFDHYLADSATALHTLAPAERSCRPTNPAQAGARDVPWTG